MDDLKPCPFCGGEDNTIDYISYRHDSVGVVCKCGAQAPSVGLWNTRPAEDRLAGEIGDLELELKEGYERGSLADGFN